MRQDILAYVRELTKLDRKSLAEKGLKVNEEAGELAKAILPFVSAHGTRHRFITPEKILEEVADVILVALSIAYDCSYDDDDVADMMKRKSDYWAQLQADEEMLEKRSPKGTPYEMHVTIAEAPSVEAFSQVCAVLKVKPIILDLQLQNDGVIKDVMTSSVYFGRNNTEAYLELTRIADGLTRGGFSVVRRKIETVPWHPAAPSRRHANAVMPPACYFECHFNVKLVNEADRARLEALALANDCHLSRNVFKRLTDGSTTVMMTLRRYTGTYEDVQELVDATTGSLRAEGFSIEKEIVEFSIYDSKVDHDAAWIKEAA
jgi:NTP pyrophosphatase (non-canonical NTP hydrolase)